LHSNSTIGPKKENPPVEKWVDCIFTDFTLIILLNFLWLLFDAYSWFLLFCAVIMANKYDKLISTQRSFDLFCL